MHSSTRLLKVAGVQHLLKRSYARVSALRIAKRGNWQGGQCRGWRRTRVGVSAIQSFCLRAVLAVLLFCESNSSKHLPYEI